MYLKNSKEITEEITWKSRASQRKFGLYPKYEGKPLKEFRRQHHDFICLLKIFLYKA